MKTPLTQIPVSGLRREQADTSAVITHSPQCTRVGADTGTILKSLQNSGGCCGVGKLGLLGEGKGFLALSY